MFTNHVSTTFCDLLSLTYCIAEWTPSLGMVTIPIYGDGHIVDGYLMGTACTSKTPYWVNWMSMGTCMEIIWLIILAEIFSKWPQARAPLFFMKTVYLGIGRVYCGQMRP